MVSEKWVAFLIYKKVKQSQQSNVEIWNKSKDRQFKNVRRNNLKALYASTFLTMALNGVPKSE